MQQNDISSISDGGGYFGLVLIAAMAITAIAPVGFSLKARNGVSAVVSLALTILAVGTLATGGTVVHQALAAVLYMAALLSSSTFYAAKMIEKAIFDRSKTATPLPTTPSTISLPPRTTSSIPAYRDAPREWPP